MQEAKQEQLANHKKLIDKKLEKLRKYDDFLKRVQVKHQDMFIELQDILSRHQVLSDSNATLRQKRKEKEQDSEQITKQMEKYIKEQTIKKLEYNNNIGTQQKTLEDFESEKAKLSRDNEENTTNRLKKTSEHGQILMTINNMYETIMKRGSPLIAQNVFKD